MLVRPLFPSHAKTRTLYITQTLCFSGSKRKVKSIINSKDSQIVKILAWNIHGIGDKLETEVIDLISAYDIIFISETWRKINPVNTKEKSRDQESLEKLDFKTIEFCR